MDILLKQVEREDFDEIDFLNKMIENESKQNVSKQIVDTKLNLQVIQQ